MTGLGAFGDHLWQSTVFALAAALVALALGRGRAHVRYGIWLAASIKFLVPFAALMALGDQLQWRTQVPIASPAVSNAIGLVSQPFSAAGLSDPVPVAPAAAGAPAASPLRRLLPPIWIAGACIVAGVWVIRWRRVSRLRRGSTLLTDGREVEILRRVEQRMPDRRPLPIFRSTAAVEPGVFGIVTPVLLWPGSIGERLTDQQVEAIVAHELAHVRRRDNLTAAMHMVVQTIFWFHPAVWWIGGRLVDERERACDQDVIRLGSEPGVYAEGILKTVQFYLESPLVCVSGVTGSDLKQRIEDIMHNRAGVALNSWTKLLLAAAGVATLAGPLLVDRVDAQAAAPAQATGERLTFETASVKPNRSGEMRVMMRTLPGGAYEATNVTARAMLMQALQIAEFQLIGAPAWVDSERYDILAKSPEGAAPAEFAQRYRALIEDRFKLKTRRESRELPVYALVLARPEGKLGPAIVPSKSDCSPEGMAAMRAQMNAGAPPAVARGGGVPMMMMPAMAPLGQARVCTTMRNGGQIMAGGATLAEMTRMLQQNTGRIVLDRTGLTGRYDFDLKFTPDPALSGRGMGGGLPPDPARPQPPVDPDAITIFSAVQDQLGLKLESTRGPVDVVIIESMEKASEN